jgi:ribosomal protein S18 acetylase RimI-like enzyme
MDRLDERVARVASDGSPVELGPLEGASEELYWVFADVVARSEGYPDLAPLTHQRFGEVWGEATTLVVVARSGGSLLGAYYLKPNLPGRGAHVANAGYVVARAARRRGIGRLLVADSVERAPLAGFDAIQFNFVFESNPARGLYESLGWRVVGRIPGGVMHPGGAREDALVYWRSVGDASSAAEPGSRGPER